MNLRKALIASLVALTLTGVASAQTIIRITGAQAFGDAAHRAIKNVLTAGGAFTYAYTGTDINKAQQSIWTGTVTGNAVIFKTSWNGSTAGIRVVTQATPIPFLVNSTAQSSGGTPNAPNTGASIESIAADATTADTFQSSTIYTNPTLVDRLVGAGAYVFVTNVGAPSNFTNITSLQAQALYSNGNLPLAVFTGSASDRTTIPPGFSDPVQIFATGRDPESGARLVTLIETGIGANSYVVQYKPVISGSAVVSHGLYPATTLNGVPLPAGDDGNPSNGNLATVVLNKTTLAGIGGYYVSYLPTLDAANAVAAGARMLSYNGVPYSPAAVSEGQYSLWAYEHLLYKNGLGVIKTSVLDTLATRLHDFDATLLISSLQVSRPVDGGIIVNSTY